MKLSPEWKLVLSASRAALLGSEPEASVGELAAGPLDWRRVGAIACQNRIGPLVYASLRRLPLPEAAQSGLRLLHASYLATAARNAALFGALGHVLEAFAAERLAVIVLKGAALAETAYPERALRPMSDIDLLVREDDLEKAERRLQTAGYEAAHDPGTKRELRARHHHLVFRSALRRSGGIPIELHWNLDPPGGPVAWDIDGIFERATDVSLGGARALVLAPEDLLLHLSLHLCRHRFNGGVIALCDVAAAISKHQDSLDWTRVRTRALECGGEEHLLVPLRLAGELVGADVPPEVTAARADLDPVLELARERILEEKGDIRGAAELRLRWRRRGFGARVAATRRALSPPAGKAGPTGANSLPARLASLLHEYGPWIWSLARHPGFVSAVVKREESKAVLDSWCSASEPLPR